MCSSESDEYELLKHNLKIYNSYLNQCIRTAKKVFYYNEFSKYKNYIRKTWDTLKEVINKKTHLNQTFLQIFLMIALKQPVLKTSPINSMSTSPRLDHN